MFLSSSFHLIVILQEESSKEESSSEREESDSDSESEGGEGVRIVYRWMVHNCQLSILLPEDKRAIKRQLYSGPFTLREAASFIF